VHILLQPELDTYYPLFHDPKQANKALNKYHFQNLLGFKAYILPRRLVTFKSVAQSFSTVSHNWLVDSPAMPISSR